MDDSVSMLLLTTLGPRYWQELALFLLCLWTAVKAEDSVFLRAESMEWMAEMYRSCYHEVQIWISCKFLTSLEKFNDLST